MTVRSEQPIFLVEDSPEDYEVTVRAFKKASLANPVYRCQDGEEALDFLYQRRRLRRPGTGPRDPV